MEVSGIASVASSIAQKRTADAVDTAVLKKALDTQVQAAASMISNVVRSPDSLPSHVGRNVNVVA